MLKRSLSIILAVVLTLSMAVTAMAAYGGYSMDFDGLVAPAEAQSSITLPVDSTTDIPLCYYDQNGNNQGFVDRGFYRLHKITASITDGRGYATVSITSKSGMYYLTIKTKASTSKNDKNLTVEIMSRETGGDRRYDTSSTDFTIISDASSATDSISSYDQEYSIAEGRRVSVECDENINRCRLNVGGSAYVDVKARRGDILTFNLKYDDQNDDVSYAAPNDANLIFYNFKTSPTFRQPVKVGLSADYGQKYLYSINSNNRLTNIPATLNNGYLVFSTTKPAYYVISDRKLAASSNSSTTNSDNNNTTEPSTPATSNTGSGITLSTLQSAFANVNSGSTVKLMIEDNDTVSLDDLKSAARSYPGRNLCIAHRVNNRITYQYFFSAGQISTLKSSNNNGYLNLGMSSTATDTLSVFNRYYSNKTLALEHNNKGSFGANASYAVHIGGSDISHNNLKVYWYDAGRNYFEKVPGNVTIDKNNYLYFNAPAGYDIVVSDGNLVKK
ncbi:MAG: hypothetical protein RSF33_03680 [Hydrogenoanaerobacterium sp.]